MKRPKLKDMGALELARWSLLQAHRRAQRGLRYLEYIPPPHRHCAEADAAFQAFSTIIAVTEPSLVSKASLRDCVATLRCLGSGQRGLN
jgi:hypothetical protein